MRVLTRSNHDDHDLGSVYDCTDEELLPRLLAGGIVVPAAEWTYQYHAPSGPDGEERHAFTRVAPAAPLAEVAPAPAAPAAEASVAEVAPAPVAIAPESLVTRSED